MKVTERILKLHGDYAHLISFLGGCGHCNGTAIGSGTDCLCLHAEENALLEAGRDRVGPNAILYCNT